MISKERFVTLAALAVALACGCGGKPEQRRGHDDHDDDHEKDHDDRAAAHGDDHDRHAGGAQAGAATSAELVRIHPEMIRDLRVTTAKAESRRTAERISALGELRVNQDAYAEVAAPAPARVAKVLARAGDRVVAGQPLVTLHSADLGRARAELDAAKKKADLAGKTLARKRALAADRLIPEREVLEAEAALADAEADRDIAAAAVRPYAGGAGPGGLVLRAPVAGTIIDRDVALGQLADPSRTLYRIADLSSLWLVAHVFERDAVRVRPGTAASATFAALPGTTVDATITWIGSEVDPSSRTIPVRLDVRNPDGALRPGMSAMVSLPLGDATDTVVAVPIAAVQRVAEEWSVFLPRGNGAFEVRAIGRGRELGGEVEVVSGLAAGDEVVVDGAFLLKAEADKARGEGGGHHDH